MSKDDLIKRYKEQLALSSEKAPEGLWDNIARNLDADLISLYQNELNQNTIPAPEGIWDNIEHQLDSGIIQSYKEQLAENTSSAPEGIWDNIERQLDSGIIQSYKEQLAENSSSAPENIWDNIERQLDSGIIQSYKKQLAENQSSAPEGIWENIERSLDAPLIGSYKTNLEKNSVKAPIELWDNIEKKLDVDDVWNRVTASLDTQKKRSSLWFYVARAAAVVGIISTLGIGGWFAFERLQQPQLATYDANQNQLPSAENNQETNLDNSALDAEISLPPVNLPELAHFDQPTMAISEQQVEEQPSLVPVSFENVSFLRLMSRQPSLNQNYSQQLQLAFAHKAKHPERILPGELQQESQFPQLALNGTISDSRNISFGFAAGIKNTWLFNNETFLGLEGYNGHRTEVSFVPDFALSLRYRFRPQWAIEAGFTFNSNVEQTYYQFIHGRFGRKDVSLNYIHGEILANYLSKRSWMLGQNSIRLNSVLGFYFAGLNNAYESIRGEKFDITQKYQNMDFGLIIGQNVDIELAGNFTLSPGIRLTWGLPNIHTRMPDIPEFMWRTLNRSFEFRVAVMYRLPFEQ
ncbi:MAG TPA: outer membrane beta-barrel protein [Bacteroidales bacterium]|nr:outer membrane beta-barrel protein [Bacteroidales bacterium]